jgi:hypothetical protein
MERDNCPMSFIDRGKVTTEVLETLATAKTCTDCQVFSHSFPAYLAVDGIFRMP